MAKTMKKLDSKLQKQQQGWLNSQIRQENTTEMKIWKIATAKFKCTREHILGHDWLIKITWDEARARGEFRVCKVQNILHAPRAISAFWKTHSCKLIPNWTRNRMITYTNCIPLSSITIINRDDIL